MRIRGTANLMTRSLRVDNRSLITYALRFGVVAFMLMALYAAHESAGYAAAPGLTMFTGIATVNMIIISLAGLTVFSATITEEKEEMTLALLRMTNLNALSILLGKTVSRLLAALLLLLAQFPFTLLAITLGGVSIQQIVAVYCTLAAYTLLLCGVAVFCSVIARRTSTAAVMTLVIMLLFMVLPWLITVTFVGMGMVMGTGRPAVMPGHWANVVLDICGWLQQASPVTRIYHILAFGFGSASDDQAIGFQVITNAAAGGAFLLLAWLCFERFNRQMTEAAPVRPVNLARLWTRRKSRRAGAHALLWKDYHYLAGGYSSLIGKMVAYALILLALWLYARQFADVPDMDVREAVGITAMYIFYVAFVLEASLLGGRTFREEIIRA